MTWSLEGVDSFEGTSYPLSGGYASEASVRRAAHKRLRTLEREQPSAASGGQDGIQDHVIIVHPDGRKERVRL